MPEPQTEVQLEIVRGEDFACQIWWTDEYGDPVPVTEPVLMDVKDADGQVVMRFTTSSNALTEPHVTVSGGSGGFFQLTVPSDVTSALIPGVYLTDLFAAVSDSAPPFLAQRQRVFKGTVLVESRQSDVNDPDIEAGLLPPEE